MGSVTEKLASVHVRRVGLQVRTVPFRYVIFFLSHSLTHTHTHTIQRNRNVRDLAKTESVSTENVCALQDIEVLAVAFELVPNLVHNEVIATMEFASALRTLMVMHVSSSYVLLIARDLMEIVIVTRENVYVKMDISEIVANFVHVL